MAQTDGLQNAAQYLAIAVYIAVSGFGLVVAWRKRASFQSINKDKPAGFDADLGLTTDSADLPASFSRTVGLAGAIGLGGFMWSIGLLLLVGHPLVGVEGFSKSLQEFILAGAALFAPYAFNQLAKVFPQTLQSSTTASVTADAIRADLKTPIPPPQGA